MSTTTSTGFGGLAHVLPLVSKGRAETDGSNVDMNYLLGIDSVTGVLAADFEEGAAASSPGQNHPMSGATVVSSGTWHHAAATYDGSTLRLYLDGVLDASLVVGQPSRGDSIQHAALGSALNSTGAPAGYFQGVLDEARVWSVARSGAQVAASMSDESITGPGLVGRWALDDGAGTVVHGSVGIDGTTVGGPTWTSGFTISSPPSTPDLQAPTDGTTGLGTAVGLSAAVDDPAGQPMTVTFFGRPYASGTFAQVAMRTGIPPGQIVTTTWNDLGQGQRFEWYVVADNGSSSSRSAARTFWTASGTDPVLVGAGDIARCDSTGDEASGAVLSGVAGQVFTTGDNTYVNGTSAEFAACYDPSWGPARSRTRPVPGNHDWNTGTLAGYSDYFGAAATDSGGHSYYSYDISSRWHAVVVDTECVYVGGCGAGSPQDVWLRSDLAAHADDNVVVLWHKPRFSSGPYGTSEMQRFVDDLYAAGVDLLLCGHDHIYERFVPLDPTGAVDTSLGVPMITVGTGGAEHHQITAILPGSQVRNNDTYGVLKLTLHDSSFDWQFLPEDGHTFTDRGSLPVHAAPAPPAPSVTQVSISPAQPRTADTVTAAATGTDPSGLSLTYDYQWLRNGVAVAGATGTSLDLGLAGAGDRGDQVTVRVRAFNGSSWSAPVTSSAVTVADTAPAIAVITDRTTVEGSAASLSVSASDVDGDSLRYTATGLPPGLALNVASGQVAGTPALGSAGAYSVTIVVNDGSLTASRSFTWTVTAADLPPTAPTGLVARASTTSVALDWADGTEVDVAGYRVYRATSASGPFTQLGGTLTASTSTDQAPLLGSAVYAVATVDLAGQESARTTVSVDRRVTLLGVSTATRASVKSLSVNRPANLLTNDVLLAVVVTPSSQIPTAPSGWTRVRTDVSGNAVRQSVYVRRVSASEPASYSWSVSGKDDISIAVLGYRGADGTMLPASGGSVTASSTLIPAASVATTAGYLLVSTFAVRGTASLTEPATYDARARLVSPTSRSTTLLVTDAVATTTGSTTLPQAVSGQATTGLGASMSWRVL